MPRCVVEVDPRHAERRARRPPLARDAAERGGADCTATARVGERRSGALVSVTARWLERVRQQRPRRRHPAEERAPDSRAAVQHRLRRELGAPRAATRRSFATTTVGAREAWRARGADQLSRVWKGPAPEVEGARVRARQVRARVREQAQPARDAGVAREELLRADAGSVARGVDGAQSARLRNHRVGQSARGGARSGLAV